MNENGLEQELAQLQSVYDMLTEFLVQYSFQLVGATLIFLLGLWVAGKVSNLVIKQFEKHQIDITLSNFVSNLARIIVLVIFGVIALGKLGISITPMVAAIGAASLGAGLALQGMLSNYAAGITIIVTRPFVIGNTIEVKGVSGVVKDIHLGLTLLTNEEGEVISIPNKHIVGEILHNSFEYKLITTTFNVSYNSDINQVITLATKILNSNDAVNQQRPPQIGINGFNSVGLEVGMRYWVPTQSYFQHKYQINLDLMKALQQAGITIPCPIKEIHIEK
ncbi:mechanosensitive ion channel family protein [Shewanella sp. Isolate11]|uniref:mechanosensitive ion channel family protein n=1 Tax=Shewanella sp. Isolate11 TaxID=2908530 RepID=UPI001EFED3F2|nr:mechanosensitive ion channel family protein [Shewanella sp. Isolate11]MCG9698245.1 mechanosensitive ion channel family protein [Shewanella sp. Isolate11]